MELHTEGCILAADRKRFLSCLSEAGLRVRTCSAALSKSCLRAGGVQDAGSALWAQGS